MSYSYYDYLANYYEARYEEYYEHNISLSNITKFEYDIPYNMSSINSIVFPFTTIIAILSIFVSIGICYKIIQRMMHSKYDPSLSKSPSTSLSSPTGSINKSRTLSLSQTSMILTIICTILYCIQNILDPCAYYTRFMNYNANINYYIYIAYNLIWICAKISFYLVLIHRYYLIFDASYFNDSYLKMKKLFIFGCYATILLIQLFLYFAFFLIYYELISKKYINKQIMIILCSIFLLFDLILIIMAAHLFISSIFKLLTQIQTSKHKNTFFTLNDSSDEIIQTPVHKMNKNKLTLETDTATITTVNDIDIEYMNDVDDTGIVDLAEPDNEYNDNDRMKMVDFVLPSVLKENDNENEEEEEEDSTTAVTVITNDTNDRQNISMDGFPDIQHIKAKATTSISTISTVNNVNVNHLNLSINDVSRSQSQSLNYGKQPHRTETIDIQHRYKTTSDSQIHQCLQLYEDKQNDNDNDNDGIRKSQFRNNHPRESQISLYHNYSANVNNNNKYEIYNKKQLKLLNISSRIILTSFISLISSFIFQLIWLICFFINNGNLLWYSYIYCLNAFLNIICIYLQLGIAKNLYNKLCITICKCHQFSFKCFEHIIRKKTKYNQNIRSLHIQTSAAAENIVTDVKLLHIKSPRYQYAIHISK